MITKLKIKRCLSQLCSREDGAAMVEAIIALPVLTFLTFGMLEFGSLFWQREQIETGLRDAARYVARCGHDVAVCQGTARNLAYHGSTAALATLRVPQWNTNLSPIIFEESVSGSQTMVSATSTHQLVNSPLLGFLGVDEINITASHNQRVIGW